MEDAIEDIFAKYKIIIGDGMLTILGTPCILLPLNSHILLHKILRKKYGLAASSYLYFAGKFQGKLLLNAFVKNYRSKKTLQTLKSALAISEVCGLGRLRLVSLYEKEGRAVIENPSCPYCKQYVKLFGKSRRTVHEWMQGFCAGLMEEYFGKPMAANSKTTISEGNAACIIETSSSVEDSPYVLPEESQHYDAVLKSATRIYRREGSAQTIATKRVLAHQQMSYSNGRLAIWNIPGMAVPCASIAVMSKLFNELGTEMGNALYHIGRMQAVGAVNIQVNHFGVKADSKLLQDMVAQAEFMGAGKMDVEKFEPATSNVIVTGKNCVYSLVYENMYGKQEYPCDNLIRGLITGACQGVLGKKVVGFETKSPATGQSKTEIIVNRSHYFSTALVKAQLPVKVASDAFFSKHMTIKAFMAP